MVDHKGILKSFNVFSSVKPQSCWSFKNLKLRWNCQADLHLNKQVHLLAKLCKQYCSPVFWSWAVIEWALQGGTSQCRRNWVTGQDLHRSVKKKTKGWMLKPWYLEYSMAKFPCRLFNYSLNKVMKCLDCHIRSSKELSASIRLCFPPKVFKLGLEQILHQTLILTCHRSLFDTRTDLNWRKGPPAKHCLCFMVSFHVRKLRNHRRAGGCLFHVPMAHLFHKGWSVNSQLVLTAANEKHEPFLNTCHVPLGVLCQYSWIWQEHVSCFHNLCFFNIQQNWPVGEKTLSHCSPYNFIASVFLKENHICCCILVLQDQHLPNDLVTLPSWAHSHCFKSCCICI